MLQHIQYLVLTEHRPFCYLDFCAEKVKDQPYAMAHGTYRNEISKLKKLGIVEQEYNAGTAFHTLTGVHFGKKRKSKMMTPMMTPNHMGVSPVTNTNSVIADLPIYKELQKLPPENRALHDIHYRFPVPDSWKIIHASNKYSEHPVSKDIFLPSINTNNLRLRTTVHHTDTVTVVVGCSGSPVAITADDIIRLSIALTRAEERLSRVLDECGSILPDGYESIPIPDHGKWIVTLWHFGTDSCDFREYAEEKYCCTWQEGQNVLNRVYSKSFRTRNKNKVVRRRREIQERLNKSFGDALKEKLGKEGL
jgi:hypothetical protein